jgi:hypothetical protein
MRPNRADTKNRRDAEKESAKRRMRQSCCVREETDSVVDWRSPSAEFEPGDWKSRTWWGDDRLLPILREASIFENFLRSMKSDLAP